MKNNKKLLALVCIVALLAVSAFGTLAYLTDTAAVTNTFTVGKVDIELTEAQVDENGQAIEGAERVLENEYHLVPAAVFDKDPTMTIKANSEKSYVRMILNVYNADEVLKIVNDKLDGDFAGMLIGWDKETWKYVDCNHNTAADIISFEFRYETKDGDKTVDTVKGEAEDYDLPPLFEQLKIPETLDTADVEALNNSAAGEKEFKMVVEGHAIQALGFESAKEAWDAFEAQYAEETQVEDNEE